MAVLSSIRNFFHPPLIAEPETIVPAPPTDYEIKSLTDEQLLDVLRLNIRCFRNGDNYTKHTFEYLLGEPRTLSYRIVTAEDLLVAFAFVMVNDGNAAHLTTIGVAPEHRGRGLAKRLLRHIEDALRVRNVGTIILEVRLSNLHAQSLYQKLGYTVVQRIAKYYSNGEDCLLMLKPIY
jgi:ribosomal-protein-alanine N-acetyltransferase